MKRICISVFLTLLLVPSAATQDAEFPRYTFFGQVRHRFEANDRDFNKGTDVITFNLLRSRLGVRFLPVENTEAFLQVQDSRVFGEELNTLTDGEADQLDLHQGYVKITNLFNRPLDLQLGRFEAVYGSQRLIGAVGWHNVGRSFDGVLLRLHPKSVKIDLFNLKLVEELEPGGKGDLNVMGAYGDFQLIENYTTQAFVIWQRANPSSELNRFTLGLYLTGTTANFRPEIDLAYQGGEREEFDVSAMLVALNLGYTMTGIARSPGISVGVDYLSGDDDPTDGTYKVFDTLYATNHKFYGFMDYFLNIPANTVGLGLRDVHAKISFMPQSDLRVGLAYHHFSANEDFMLVDGTVSTRFGDEVDLTLVFPYNQRVSFIGGAALFAPGPIFKETQGEDRGAWGYVMTVVNL